MEENSRYSVYTIIIIIIIIISNFAKKFQADLHEIFREVWQWADGEMIKFWWPSGSESGSPYRDSVKTLPCLDGGRHCPVRLVCVLFVLLAHNKR